MEHPKRVLVACSMMEDEIRYELARTVQDLPVVWMDRGLHNNPSNLREELQRQISLLQEYDEILMAYGLCGNGTEGLSSPHARLILPRFDDCINLMLCTGPRTARALTRADSLYLTRGWTKDSESILQQYEDLSEKYDEETRDVIFEMMYEHYNAVTVIDTGCYDTAPVYDYAGQAAGLLELRVDTAPGSTGILRQLLLGEWDENFIVLEAGDELSSQHFEV